LSYRLQIWYAALYGECQADAQIISLKVGLARVTWPRQFQLISLGVRTVRWPAPNIGQYLVNLNFLFPACERK